MQDLYTRRPSGARTIAWQAFAALTKPDNQLTSSATMVEFATSQFCVQGLRQPIANSRTYVRDAGARIEGRPIPAGAAPARHKLKARREPRPLAQYWLDGRECRFARRYSDPTRYWNGWAPLSQQRQAKTMAELLRPRTLRDFARHWRVDVYMPVYLPPVSPVAANDNNAGFAVRRPDDMERTPLIEEHKAGRIKDRHWQALGWFLRVDPVAVDKPGGVGKRSSESGVISSFSSRNPLALWPTEHAADLSLRMHKRMKRLGPLAPVLAKAFSGAEMAALAPKAIPFPQRHIAQAGRIRLTAALEICARMAEDEARIKPLYDHEVQDILQRASDDCWKLAATRRMRVANDNICLRSVA